MKRLWIFTMAVIALWPAMSLAGGNKGRHGSHGARHGYELTVIAEFKPPFGAMQAAPSSCATGPVITSDGVIVYSTGSMCNSSVFSTDGTTVRWLDGFPHMDEPLEISVSGNGMMVTNTSPHVIDVYDGTILRDWGWAGTGSWGVGQVSINNRGSIAYTGGAPELCNVSPWPPIIDYDGGVLRFDGETTTTIAEYGSLAWGPTIMAFPSINDSGRVAFLVAPGALSWNYCPSTRGLQDGYLFVGDGRHLSEIAEVNSSSLPSLNNRGDVGFIGLSDGALSVLVGDGKKTRIVADTHGAFTDFPYSQGWYNVRGVSINDRGELAFVATVHGVGDGIFIGPDPDRDKVIATGDLLAGSSVSGGIILSRQSLNNKGQIAFQVTLADGRMLVVRAEERKGVN